MAGDTHYYNTRSLLVASKLNSHEVALCFWLLRQKGDNNKTLRVSSGNECLQCRCMFDTARQSLGQTEPTDWLGEGCFAAEAVLKRAWSSAEFQVAMWKEWEKKVKSAVKMSQNVTSLDADKEDNQKAKCDFQSLSRSVSMKAHFLQSANTSNLAFTARDTTETTHTAWWQWLLC